MGNHVDTCVVSV